MAINDYFKVGTTEDEEQAPVNTSGSINDYFKVSSLPEKTPEKVNPIADKFAGQELTQTKEDKRKEETVWSRLARVVLPESLETKFGVNEMQRKAPELTPAEQVKYQGNLVTKKLMEENPDKIDPMEYFSQGLTFGHSNDPLGSLQNYIKGVDMNIMPSDLPEPTTTAQKLAYTAGNITTMALAQPLISAGVVGIVSKIPGGVNLLNAIKDISMVNRPFDWATKVLAATGEGSLFGLITKNKKTVAENVVDTAGAFAGFTALAYPVQMFFKPIIQSVGKTEITPNNMSKFVNDPAIAQQPISKTLWFTNPKDSNQLLKVTANGVQFVPRTANEVALAGNNLNPITKLEIEAFQKNPSLYENLVKWVEGKKIGKDKIPFTVKDNVPPPTDAPVMAGEVPKTDITSADLRAQVVGKPLTPETTNLKTALSQFHNNTSQTEFSLNNNLGENIASIKTVEYSDGKIAVAINADIPSAGLTTSFEESKLYTSEKDAIADAKKEIVAWANDVKKRTITPEDETALNDIVEKIQNPKEVARRTNEELTNKIVESTLAGQREDLRLTNEKALKNAVNYNDLAPESTPETVITVYRASTEPIKVGDSVSISESGAKKYVSQRTGSELFTIDVPLKDLVRAGGTGNEFIYAPKKAESMQVEVKPMQKEDIKKGAKVKFHKISKGKTVGLEDEIWTVDSFIDSKDVGGIKILLKNSKGKEIWTTPDSISLVTTPKKEEIAPVSTKKPQEEPKIVKKEIKSADEIVDYVDEVDRSTENPDFVNEDDRGILPFTKKQIKKSKNYELTTLKISDLLEKDLDLKEYVDANEQRYVGERDFFNLDNPIVVGENMEVIDGMNRILTLKNNGVKEVKAYVPIKEVKKVEVKKPKEETRRVLPSTKTLAPSKAVTPEEIAKEQAIALGDRYNLSKTLVTKADFKNIISNNSEFAKNPVLTVDANKNLTFKGKTSEFKIKAEAVGLNPKNINEGEFITVDTNALKAKGAPQQMRAYSGGEAFASSKTDKIGAFESYSVDETRPREEFKLYKRTLELNKKYGKMIGEGKMKGGKLGLYYPGTGNVRVTGLNDLSTMVHELTHSLDYALGITKDILKPIDYADNGNPIYNPDTLATRRGLTKAYVDMYPGASPKHALKKRLVEGMAVLVENYSKFPTSITNSYPELVKDFLKEGGKYYEPVIGEFIKDIRKTIEDYQSLSSLDKIGARVTSDINQPDSKDFFSVGQRIRTQVADNIYPLEILDIKAGTENTLESISLWTRQYNNANQIVNNNIAGTRGYWNYSAGEFTKKLDYNWNTLVKKIEKEGNLVAFGNYLVARDQYFNYQKLGELKTAVDQKEYQTLKKVLDNNLFTEEEVTDAYNQNKEKFAEDEKQYDEMVKQDIIFLANPDVALVTPEKLNEMLSTKGYASLKREVYDEVIGGEDFIGVTGGKGKITSLKARTGSSKIIINPVLSGIKNHAEITKKGLRQIVYNKIAKMGASNQFPELFQRLELVSVPDKNTGAMTFPQEKDKSIIMGRINGKRIPILTDKYLKTIVDDVLDVKNIGMVEKVIMGASRFFTKGTTGLYPQFAFSNLVIDSITVGAQTQEKTVPIYSSLKELANIYTTKDSDTSKYFTEYMVMGGERQTLVGWQNMSASELAQKVAQERTGLLKVIDYANAGMNVLAIPAKYSEIMSRATEYIRARRAGKPQIVALEQAGRITAPFHHIGRLGGSTVGKSIIKSIPFFNPAIQVLDQFSRVIQTPARRKRMLFAIIALTAAMVAGEQLVMQKGTKEQKETFAELDPTELAKYLYYPDPNGKDLRKLRVPDQMAIPGTILNMFVSDMWSNANYTAGEYLSAGTSFLPSQLNVFKPDVMLFSWLPQFIKPAIMTAGNVKDFPQIMPMESQTQQRKPAGLRKTEGTSIVAAKVGEMLNISPIKIDYLLTGYLGRASGFFTGKKSSYELLSTITRKSYFESGRKVQAYYDLKEKNDQMYNSYKNKSKEFSRIQILDILDERAKIKRVTEALNSYGDLDPKQYQDQTIFENKVDYWKGQVLKQIENL